MTKTSARIAGLLAAIIAVTTMDESAQAADPTTADCLAASESSLTLRNQHKLRDARAQLLVCSAASCPSDIRHECVRRVGEVNAAMPTIVFEAKDVAGNDLSAVKVTMDGQPIAERLEGPALSIDPGVHTFTFETDGQPSIQKQFVIREGDKDRRERITFGAPSAASADVAPPVAAASAGGPSILATPSPTTVGQTSSDRWSARKKTGVALGAAGAVGLVTGVIFTLTYNSRASDFDSAGCFTSLPDNGPAGCQSRRDSVKSAEELLVVGYSSALVLGGIGAYLFLAAPTEATSSVALRPSSLSLHCLPSGDVGVICGGRF